MFMKIHCQWFIKHRRQARVHTMKNPVFAHAEAKAQKYGTCILSDFDEK